MKKKRGYTDTIEQKDYYANGYHIARDGVTVKIHLVEYGTGETLTARLADFLSNRFTERIVD